jgi:lysophospholipase L1-like esterase
MRVCFFGESYVNGIGDPTTLGWVGRLAARARARGVDITVYNCGIRGATSSIVRASWLAEAHARLVDVESAAVVFSFGTNDSRIIDSRERVSAAEQVDNLRIILADASVRWPTLMIGPPPLALEFRHTPREEQHNARCQAMAQVCADFKVPFFDTLVASASFEHWSHEAAAGDGYHPGAAGYAELAAAVDAWQAWQNILRSHR